MQSLHAPQNHLTSRFIILTAVGALAYAAVGVSAPLMSLYLESLGASYRAMSGVFTTYVIVLIVANYFWGRIIDRFPHRTSLLIISLAGVSLSFWIMSQAPTYQIAWLTRISEAIFVAGYTTLSLTLIGEVVTQSSPNAAKTSATKTANTGRRMGIYRGFGSAAFALGALLGGRVADATSLSTAFTLCTFFYATGALCAVALAPRWTASRPPLQSTQPALPAPLPAQPDSPALASARLPLFFLAGVAFWTAAHSASASMWPNYMAHLGYSASAIGALWGLAAFIEFPAMVGAGLLSDLIGRTAVLVSGGIGIAITNTGYIVAAASLNAIILIQLCRGWGFGSFTTASMIFTAETGGASRRGRTSGVYYAATGIGQLLGMSLGGNIVQSFGFPTLFAVCASFAAISAISFWVMHQVRKPHLTPLPPADQTAHERPPAV